MSISPTLREAQAAGFTLGGEPSLALDLIDTTLHAHAADRTELLDERADAWWELESGRLPAEAAPAPADVARLRDALREVIEARIDGIPASARAIETVNRYAGAAARTPRLTMEGDRASFEMVWERRGGASARLAAIAQDGIELVGDPERSAQLRRCGNPTCTMVFLADNPRRTWCAPNVCGNRMRVARHQQRRRTAR